jgi:mannose-6-phosphate isomerase-like protein (cupin superfamily)
MTLEYRPWGTFEVLFEAPGIKVKRLIVNPGHRLSLQRHKHRKEVWHVIKADKATVEYTNNYEYGEGWNKIPLTLDSVITIWPNTWHRLENVSGELEILEVQTGTYLGEDDIERMADDYGRAKI